MGRALAHDQPVEADVVVPVPDSGVAAALGYAEAAGLPFELGLIRSHYVGRTFIEPAQSIRHFGVRLKLHNVTGRDGMAMLRADQADFAVGSMLEVPEDIDYRPIFDFKTMLITPLDHPLAGKRAANIKLEDISPHGLILPPRHLATWRRVEMIFGQHKVNYTVTLEAGGWEVIKKYVEMGLGIAIVTAICLKGDEKITKIPLDRFFPNRSYGVVMRKRKYLSPPARQFLEMMAPDFSGQLEKSVGE